MQNDNGDKPAKKSRLEYYRQYRLNKKLGAKLNSDSAKIILMQEMLPSEYSASATAASLTQSSPVIAPTVIQHEAVIEASELSAVTR